MRETKKKISKIVERPYEYMGRTKDLPAQAWLAILGQVKISAHRYNTLLEAWRKKIEPQYGKQGSMTKKGNISSLLSSDKMTWNTLQQGIQILSALGDYKSVTVEFKFVLKNGDTMNIPVPIISEDGRNNLDIQRDRAKALGLKTLEPMFTAKPLNVYLLAGFENAIVNGLIVRYNGTMANQVHGTHFNAWTTTGTLLFESTGLPSSDWAIIEEDNLR